MDMIYPITHLSRSTEVRYLVPGKAQKQQIVWVATTSIRGQNRLVFGVSILPVMGFANHVPRQSYIYQCMSGYRRHLCCIIREKDGFSVESSGMLWKRPGESVIIHQSCSDKVSQTGDFNKRNDFLIITEPGSP